jgi:type II secretory pathway pseudopilin PulG
MSKMIHSQAGDTLIEAVIAISIIALLMFGAYSISNKAFQLGQSSKERTQAAKILESQAEGLRSIRDNSTSFDKFRNNFTPPGTGGINPVSFHVIKSGNKWQLAPDGDWSPGGSDVAQGQSTDISSLYKVTVCGTFSTTYTCSVPDSTSLNCSSVGNDTMCVAITVIWDRIGGGPQETSTLYYHLTDRAIPVTSMLLPQQIGASQQYALKRKNQL